MSQLLPPPVVLSKVGRAAHDVGLAGLLGGNLYGRLALHPSVTEISDPAERGKVVNAAWRRYGVVNTLSLAAVTAGWLGARRDEAAPRRRGGRGNPGSRPPPRGGPPATAGRARAAPRRGARRAAGRGGAQRPGQRRRG